MYNGTRAHFAIDRGHVFPILGRRGVSVAAIAGIDMALWDILGKSLNAPVWPLLGGRRREKLPADRKSVVSGKSVSVRVDPGGRRIIKKKTTLTNQSENLYTTSDDNTELTQGTHERRNV